MKKLLVLGLLLGLAVSANAATVTYFVDASGGNFTVTATMTGGYGLALYNIFLNNATSVSNQGPMAAGKTPTSKILSAQAGFTMFRSGIGTIPPNPVGAAQDNINYVVDPIYYVGQQTIDMTETWAGPYYVPSDGQVANPAVIATGTYTGEFTISAVTTDQLVWVTDDPDDRVTDYVEDVEIVYIPEPATIGLLALGLLALFRRKR